MVTACARTCFKKGAFGLPFLLNEFVFIMQRYESIDRKHGIILDLIIFLSDDK